MKGAMCMIVVLDAGHGGRDPGTSSGDFKEKDIVLRITQKVRDALNRQFKVDVKLTRSEDVFVPLSRRAAIANEANADLFVSIHVNAGGGSGFESFIFSGTRDSETAQYQDIIHEHVLDYFRKFNVVNRGQKEANFAVLRETTMPAILLELLFIDDPNNRQLLKNESFLNGTAQAIAIGIADVLDLEEKGTTPSSGGSARPIGSGSPLYKVQVGAFRNEGNARTLADELRSKGFEAFVYLKGDLFRVQSGAFDELENAEQWAEELQRAGFEAFIHS
jgi:N-acetylmuramoyl-L-alanine amidase